MIKVLILSMFLDIFPFIKRTIRAGEFERSAFATVRKYVTDKKALGEELDGTEGLALIPSDSPQRQRQAAELYLLLERNISEEQARNRVPPEVLREKILAACHPERAEGNFALLFLPHYERQIKLFEKFSDAILQRTHELMGDAEYTAFINSLAADSTFKENMKNGAFAWGKIKRDVREYTPAVQRDMIQKLLRQPFSMIANRMTHLFGDMRSEMMFKETYQKFHDPLDFIEDAAKVLVLLPDDFLQEERIGLMGKTELEEQLRRKSQVLETTLAEVQGEKLKLSELTREELETKVQERTAELVSALKAAQEARQNLEEFSSLATHELRTPIAAVKGYLNLIKSDKKTPASPEQQKYVAEAVYANERLLTLVNAMLDVSRIELGTLAIEPSPTSLKDIAEGVLAELEPKIQEKQQEVAKNYDEAIPSINLDQSLIHAIFINLLSNAVKYTQEKGSIGLSMEKRAADVLIKVQDNGYGIPAAQQSKIFQKLFRADNARAKVVEGTGLGLYLVKSILDQTGGTIRFESEENRGTTFFVTIPLAGMKLREGSKGLS